MYSDKLREKCIIALQIDITHKIMEQWKLTPKQFIELDYKYGINDYINFAYDIYCI